MLPLQKSLFVSNASNASDSIGITFANPKSPIFKQQSYNENDDVGRDRSGRSNPAIPTAEIVGRASNFDLFKGLKQRNATLFD